MIKKTKKKSTLKEMIHRLRGRGIGIVDLETKERIENLEEAIVELQSAVVKIAELLEKCGIEEGEVICE